MLFVPGTYDPGWNGLPGFSGFLKGSWRPDGEAADGWGRGCGVEAIAEVWAGLACGEFIAPVIAWGRNAGVPVGASKLCCPTCGKLRAGREDADGDLMVEGDVGARAADTPGDG
jgi:hypothetical protein